MKMGIKEMQSVNKINLLLIVRNILIYLTRASRNYNIEGLRD